VHFLRVMSHGLARHYGEIDVGDVSAKKLAKTRMAKSVPDAGWSMLGNMLPYKSIATGGVMRVVPERYSSQTCLVCGCIPASSPKGLGARGVRQWRRDACGTLHNRDINVLGISKLPGRNVAPGSGNPLIQGRGGR
jgi:putative transposase